MSQLKKSLERIENAFLYRKNWEEVMLKRQDAIKRQKDRFVVSRPCPGFSFSTLHYPPALQELLLKCGGVLLTAKIQFYCSLSTNWING